MPDRQLSLAIGKEGQNARLAAKLTGWRIDIKNETDAAKENLSQALISKARHALAPERDLLSLAEQILKDRAASASGPAFDTLELESRVFEPAMPPATATEKAAPPERTVVPEPEHVALVPPAAAPKPEPVAPAPQAIAVEPDAEPAPVIEPAAVTAEPTAAIDEAAETDAEVAARSVARSNLFKCAVHGEDPNWGRILSAIGTTDAAFEPDAIDVAVNGVWVCRDAVSYTHLTLPTSDLV